VILKDVTIIMGITRPILMVVMVNYSAPIVAPTICMMITIRSNVGMRIPMLQNSPLIRMCDVSMSVSMIIRVLVIRVCIYVSYVLMIIDVSNVLMPNVCMSVGVSSDSGICMSYVLMGNIRMSMELCSLSSSNMAKLIPFDPEASRSPMILTIPNGL